MIKGSVDIVVYIYKSLRKLTNTWELLFVSQDKSLSYCVNTLRLIFWEGLGVMWQRGRPQLHWCIWRHRYPVSLDLDFMAIGTSSSCVLAGIHATIRSVEALQITRGSLLMEIKDISKLRIHPSSPCSTDWREKRVSTKKNAKQQKTWCSRSQLRELQLGDQMKFMPTRMELV